MNMGLQNNQHCFDPFLSLYTFKFTEFWNFPISNGRQISFDNLLHKFVWRGCWTAIPRSQIRFCCQSIYEFDLWLWLFLSSFLLLKMCWKLEQCALDKFIYYCQSIIWKCPLRYYRYINNWKYAWPFRWIYSLRKGSDCRVSKRSIKKVWYSNEIVSFYGSDHFFHQLQSASIWSFIRKATKAMFSFILLIRISKNFVHKRFNINCNQCLCSVNRRVASFLHSIYAKILNIFLSDNRIKSEQGFFPRNDSRSIIS